MTEQTLAEQSGELRRIDWSACFPFTHLFRTFRMAAHPGKIGLMLAAVLLTGIWGRVLDGLWCSRVLPLPAEVNAFWQKADLGAWREATRAGWPTVLRRACEPLRIRQPENLTDRLATDPEAEFDRVLGQIRSEGGRETDALWSRLQTDTKKSDEAKAEEIARLARQYADAYAMVRATALQGVFRSFVEFESGVFRQAVSAAISLNFCGGATDILTTRTTGLPAAAAAGGLGPDGLIRVQGGSRGLGVLACGVLALRGVQWVVCEHFWFAVLFGLPALAIWALAGGAVCRMAALNVARDERIAPKAALTFAARKFVSFFAAPLFPLGLVLVPGMVVFLGGLLMAIPGIGEIGGGLLMILPLLAGLIMALAGIGGLAGMPLMWPTIAVEGSDAFDAISRGYSYVFSRPWRAAFYAGVLTVYGAAIYLAARFFLLVALKAARFFVGAGMGLAGRPGTGVAGATKIDTLWPAPTWDHLQGERLPFGMQAWEAGGALLIALWIAVVTGLLGALLASFAMSGATVMYTLLRREVDAADLEDVFLEGEEEEEGEPAETPSEPAGPQDRGAAPPEPPAEQPPQEPPAAGDGSIDAE